LAAWIKHPYKILLLIGPLVLLLGIVFWPKQELLPSDLGFAYSACHLQPKERFSFEIKADTQASYKPAALLSQTGISSSDSKEVNQTLEGVLSFLVLRQEESSSLVVGQFDRLSLTINGQRNYEKEGKLSYPFQMNVSDDCTYSNLLFDSRLTNNEKLVLQNLLKEFQVALPRTSSTQNWESEESDSFGTYLADYQLAKGADHERKLIKTKQEYLHLISPNMDAKLEASIIESKGNITFEKGRPWLDHLTSQQGIEVFSQGNLFVESTSSFTFKALDKHSEKLALWNIKEPLKRLSAFNQEAISTSPLRTKPYEPKYPENEVTGRTVASVMKEFQELTKTGQSMDRRRALDLMVQYLRSNPKMPRELIDAIKEKSIPEEHHSTLFLALQLAESKPAQDALVQVLGDHGHTPMNRMRSSLAMQDLINPSDAVIHALATEMGKRTSPKNGPQEDYHVSRTAALALGTLAGNSRERYPELSEIPDGIEQRLVSALRSEKDPHEVALYLEAIGNTANNHLVNETGEYLQDPNPTVRAAAASALGSMTKPSSEELILNHFKKEPSSNVRLEMMKALNKKKDLQQSSIENVCQNVLLEKDPMVRVAMVHILGPRAKGNRPIIKTLVQMIRNEPRRETISLIGKYLQPRDILGKKK
jgi:hypothetical protein